MSLRAGSETTNGMQRLQTWQVDALRTRAGGWGRQRQLCSWPAEWPSVQPCLDKEPSLARLYRRANHFRQLACSGSPSLLALQTDVLLISIHGRTAELTGLALGRINTNPQSLLGRGSLELRCVMIRWPVARLMSTIMWVPVDVTT